MSPNELISLLIVIGTQLCTFATGMADAGIDEFQFYFKNFSWTKQNPLKPTKAGTTLRDTHSQQNFALENTLKYCQLNQKRKICDPEHILTPADVAQLSRQLELIYHSTENVLKCFMLKLIATIIKTIYQVRSLFSHWKNTIAKEKEFLRLSDFPGVQSLLEKTLK